MMSGDSSTRQVEGAAAVLGLADDLEVRLALEDVAHAHAEQGVVVDERGSVVFSPRPRDRARPVADPGRRSPSHSFALLSAAGIASRTTVPAVGPRPNLESGADQLGALAHELQAEVAPPASGDRADVEAAPVVADLEDPVAAVEPAWRPTARLGAGVLAHVLERLLDDPQDDRLLAVVEAVGRRRRGRSRRSAPVRAAMLLDRVA